VVGGASNVSSIELTSDCVLTEQTISHAASNGHVHVLSYMQEHGRTLREIACMVASAKGKAAAMRWLREAGTPWGTSALKSVVQYGATSGSVEMMQFPHAQGLPFDGITMLCAAVKGSLAVCEFLRSVQCPWNEDCCNAAVSCGHAHVLQWLLAHSCPNNADELLRRAGSNGSIAIIALLAASAHPRWRALRLMLQYAGGHSHLVAAQWLRAQGAEWPAVLDCVCYLSGTSITVWSGDVLAWARAEGCTSPTHVQNDPAPAQNDPVQNGAAPAPNGGGPPAQIDPAVPAAV
jgi:hypothetical protein